MVTLQFAFLLSGGTFEALSHFQVKLPSFYIYGPLSLSNTRVL